MILGASVARGAAFNMDLCRLQFNSRAARPNARASKCDPGRKAPCRPEPSSATALAKAAASGHYLTYLGGPQACG
jgi:hypothetical protein